MRGAHVTGVVGRPERADGLRELGADEIVLSVEEASGPFDLILESAGGASLGRALELVGRHGTVVTFGNSSGEPATFEPGPFYRAGWASLRGFILFAPERESYADDLSVLAGLVARGDLHTQIGHEAPWTEATAPIRALLERRIAGKAVLHVHV